MKNQGIIEFLNNITPTEKSFLKTGLYIIICIGAFSILILPILLVKVVSITSFTGTGGIGDTINGISAPFIAIMASILTFLAFWIQYKANIDQKKAYVDQNTANEKQIKYINRQRFEDTFFRLLDAHFRIVESMDIQIVSENSPNKFEKIAEGRDCFRYWYNEIERFCRNGLFSQFQFRYNTIQESYKGDLYHYYTFTYHVLKFIHEAPLEVEEKKKYASIFRASLSCYELVFLFLNGLHDNGKKKLFPLLEEYRMFDNLDRSLVLNPPILLYYEHLK
ncbi:MAG: putative phage abortive infection protein [Chitinophagales bacterium]|nr:putative phage abortive infection protein [Chitinophagales bacterium]